MNPRQKYDCRRHERHTQERTKIGLYFRITKIIITNKLQSKCKKVRSTVYCVVNVNAIIAKVKGKKRTESN